MTRAATPSEAMVRAKFPWAIWLQGPSRGPASNRNNGVHHSPRRMGLLHRRRLRGEQAMDLGTRKGQPRSVDRYDRRPDRDAGRKSPTIPSPTASPTKPAACSGPATSPCAARRLMRWAVSTRDFLEPAGEDMEFAHRYPRASFSLQVFARGAGLPSRAAHRVGHDLASRADDPLVRALCLQDGPGPFTFRHGRAERPARLQRT